MGNRGNNTIDILFCFISISQFVAEIQGFKVAETVNGPRPTDLHFFLEFLCTTLFPGIASVACLEFQCERVTKIKIVND